MTIKVLIIGTGAIGGFYGALLARQGVEVSTVCRSDYQQVKQHGFNIESAVLGNWNFKPAQVLKHADEYQDSADYILLCTKVIPGADRVALIRDALRPKTTIVFIQNGVEIEPELLHAFPDNEVISGLAFICCNRLQPGVISHLAYGKLALGKLPGGISKTTQRLCELFQQAGISCHATADIIAARWQKCIWNAPFNPLSVLSGGLLTADIIKTQEPLVRAIMQEVKAIAAAAGHPLPKDVIDSNIANTYNMPPYKTSMLLDYEAGHPMETEVILGNAVRAGHRLGVPCPHMEAMYALMQLRELQLK